MKRIYPDYYKDFKCIASKCTHNCCIGWEIEIDEDTDLYYKGIAETENPLSERLRSSIDRTADTSCFITDSAKRCPFLNNKNLCDIITELGEEHLCTICREHPRFHNELPQRIESGLGMCCEEAARIILTKSEPVKLICEGTKECDDEIVNLRDKIICTLQNRSTEISERLEDMLKLCGITLPHTDIIAYIGLFLSLERLDPQWTEELDSLKEYCKEKNIGTLTLHDTENDTLYEQLCVYLVYRHLANAPDLYEASLRAAFASLSCMLIGNLYKMHYEKGETSRKLFIDLCRMYSCEIEYSDENLYIILDELE